MMMAFILFTIALAIVRSVYSSIAGPVPKNTWKAKFKRKFLRSNDENQFESGDPENTRNNEGEKKEEASIIKKGVDFLINRNNKDKT